MQSPGEQTLHVFTGSDGTDTVVAFSADDAWSVWEEHTGEKRGDYTDVEWIRRQDDHELSIMPEPEASKDKTTKTCRQWADDNGRGFLCSTEW